MASTENRYHSGKWLNLIRQENNYEGIGDFIVAKK
jgi:hypothetical protein